MTQIYYEKYEIKGDVISQLWVNDQNIIKPWGVEFADSSAFFSLEEGVGYRYSVLEEQESQDGFSHEVTKTIRMKEGVVRLELSEWLESPTDFRRSCKLTCLEDTILMDFVLRYRFLSSSFQKGYIANKKLVFKNTRIYHQYPVETARLSNPEYSVSVSVENKIIPRTMGGFMYLRDGDGCWVLHVRMLPIKGDKEVIKLCSKWFKTKPLPSWISAPALRIPGLKKAIWYRGERKPYKNRLVRIFSPNAYPMVKLMKGEILLWEASCKIHS